MVNTGQIRPNVSPTSGPEYFLSFSGISSNYLAFITSIVSSYLSPHLREYLTHSLRHSQCHTVTMSKIDISIYLTAPLYQWLYFLRLPDTPALARWSGGGEGTPQHQGQHQPQWVHRVRAQLQSGQGGQHHCPHIPGYRRSLCIWRKRNSDKVAGNNNELKR